MQTTVDVFEQKRVRANALMIESLALLDGAGAHQAAALLDHAIVILGVRPAGQAVPVGDQTEGRTL